MSKKTYDCWFCSCGRIQYMDYEMYDWLQENPTKRYIIRVCTHCGASLQVWLSDNFDIGYDINARSVDFNGVRTIIDTTQGIEYKLIFDRGIKVPMISGGYADCHIGSSYANTEDMKEKFGSTYFPDALKKDPNFCTVDVKRLIKEVDDEDLIESISGYIVGIDWAGTGYSYEEKRQKKSE